MARSANDDRWSKIVRNMKRIVFCFSCLSLMMLWGGMLCHAQFSKYFDPQAICVKYLHTGNYYTERFQLKGFERQGEWAKSRQQLIDPFEYGYQKVELYDLASGELIYSYSFNSLFSEYRTTVAGRKAEVTKSFRECVLIPQPKAPVRMVFYSRDFQQHYAVRLETVFHPAKQRVKTVRQRWEVLEPHVVVDPVHAYDLLIVPEGYARADSAKLRRDVERCAQAILQCTPYKDYAHRISIRAVVAYSRESGISRETDSGEVRKTVAGSSFYTFGSERYLMAEDMWRLHRIATQIPYEHILLLCNTSKYGGGGIYNFYSTVSDNRYFDYVCIHELGHGMAGLADEYFTSEVAVQDFYPENVEPREPNITNLVQFEEKWQDMIVMSMPLPTPPTKQYDGKVGLFEGGGYCAKGIYRPCLTCSMKEIVYDRFCPVCVRAFQRMFDACCDR